MADPAVKAEEMMEAQERADIQTPARFQTTDLQDKGIWMTRRIREKWPHLQDRFILNWLGGSTAKNEFLFIHTKNAVALVERINENLNFTPTARVWFVLAKDAKDKEQQEEASDLYPVIAKWAHDLGADRIVDVDKFSDVPKPTIKARLGGRLLVEETMFVQLKK